MSLVTTNEDMFSAQRGIYANPNSRGELWERPASVEWIHPDGRDGFQINCGAIQGRGLRSWSLTKKKSFRLLFKSRLRGFEAAISVVRGRASGGPVQHDYPACGGQRRLCLNAARYTEQYTRDEFGRQLQRATGHVAPHGMFVHLYVNGLYWGLYNPVERPDASFSASYYEVMRTSGTPFTSMRWRMGPQAPGTRW